jgi:short-subunit dehydrogenase
MIQAHSTVLVTGASSGIGVDIAKEFAKRQCTLVLLARRQDRLEQVAQEIRQRFGVTVHVLALDATQKDAIAKVQDFLANQDLTLDVLVNNAGFGHCGYFAETDAEDQLGMIDLNIRALTAFTHAFLPAMVDRRKGGVLNVASVAAFQPGPKMAVYYASKAYVLSFSEALHEEVSDQHVHVTALCPGPTESEFASVANVQDTKLFEQHTMSSAEVAKEGVEAFYRNQAVVVSGLKNKVLAASVRFTPRFLPRKIAHYLQK